MATSTRFALDRLLTPIQDVLTPELAEVLVKLRADAATQAHLDDLAERHHEGQLTDEELTEYQALVGAADLIAVLQAKARSVLQARRAS
jgi:hypothetical protein